MRSTSALKPAAAGDPVPASERAVSVISPNIVTLGESAELRCRVNWPSSKPLCVSSSVCAPKPVAALCRFVAEKSKSLKPAIFNDGYTGGTGGYAGVSIVEDRRFQRLGFFGYEPAQRSHRLWRADAAGDAQRF